MDIDFILDSLQLGESKDLEFKTAAGGVPRSMWETYSAMANSDGGDIVLGIKETRGRFEVQGINATEIPKQFWNSINNREIVNENLLSESNTELVSIEDKALFIIHVPRAGRNQRPIYVGQNPVLGTYRRYNEGDYKCSESEVSRMLMDRSTGSSLDSRILETFGESDIDMDSLQQYRNRFFSRTPTHPWLNESNIGFLKKLGGWNRDRKSGIEGPTIAGILMFGTEDALLELSKQIHFNLDYRERMSDRPSDRWTDRLCSLDGTWTPNLFQFSQKVYPKLTEGLKLPFRYNEQLTLFPDPVRSGISPVHEALQEALVNALIHADYMGEGGIVIERFVDRFEISNPGIMLVSLEQLYRGSVSECRNPVLQRMFQLMGAGDKAGAGFDKIRNGWSSQKWHLPKIDKTVKPDRVILCLEMTSLLPKGFVTALKNRLGDSFQQLSENDVEVLAIAYAEGEVFNSRVQEISSTHSADITRMFQKLVHLGLLVHEGYGRWTSYHLPDELAEYLKAVYLSFFEESIPHNEESIPHNEESIPHNEESIPCFEEEESRKCQRLMEISKEIRCRKRAKPEQIDKVILKLCQEDYLTVEQIADFTGRKSKHLSQHFLPRLVQSGQLIRRYPNQPKHPNQSYKTNIQEENQ